MGAAKGAASDRNQPVTIRYQPNERPPLPLALGAGLQRAMLTISGIVLIPTVIVRAAGGTDAMLVWAVFASVAINGATTILQAVRLGRIGSGYPLVMGASGTAIAVSVTAVAEGGLAMLATLTAFASLLQFALSARLSLFRRVLTPTVAGTFAMLLPVTVTPVAFDLLKDTPSDASSFAAPLSALTAALVIVCVALRASGAWHLWAPVIGIGAGAAVAGLFGVYDADLVANASWMSLPEAGWPGLDLEFGPAFWSLVPAFALVSVITSSQAIGASILMQHVSWRKPRAVDFRAVQGTAAAHGVGNLLAGLMGTVPNVVRTGSAAVTELTGIAARSVGIATGAIIFALAFLPKTLAVILAVPGPVIAAFLIVIMSSLFWAGIRTVFRGGLDYRRGLICGTSFWIGVGFQNGVIFPEYFSEFAGGMLENGMTAGGLTALLMTLFVELTGPRRRRLKAVCDVSALPQIRKFLQTFALRSGWDKAMASRLQAASEETLLTLIEHRGEEQHAQRHLLLIARREGGETVLEFIATPGEENMEDRIALLPEQVSSVAVEQEVSVRLLRHLASSVHHQQYHDTDIVTIHVEAPKGSSAGGK